MNWTHNIWPKVFVALYLTGAVMMLIGIIRMLIAAFRTSILWGLGCLFLPLCMLIYLITHWEDAKSGFFLKLKGAFVCILGLVVAIAVPNWERARAAQHVQAKEHITAGQPDNDPSATNSIEKDQRVASGFQKNPTAATPSQPNLRLQGILYNLTRPSAVINGNTVFVGDKVAGWSVTAISSKTVTLQNGSGGTNTLSMN
jgi:hypothetical protein